MPEAHVELVIDLTGGGVDTFATVERGLSATGPWVMLDENVPLLGEMAVYIDSTGPLDTPVWYRIVGDVDGEEIMGPFTADSLGMVWLKDPLRPWATVAFDFCDTSSTGHIEGCTTPDPEYIWGGFGSEDWEPDAGLFPILNAERPADVWGRRKHLNGSMTFFTRSLAAKSAIYTLFTAGGPLFLQLPAVYGWTDAYIQPGTVTPSYIRDDQRVPDRKWDVPFVTVDAVTGPAQGTLCANWCAVQDAFATFADMTAAGGTWLDVATGDLVCP